MTHFFLCPASHEADRMTASVASPQVGVLVNVALIAVVDAAVASAIARERATCAVPSLVLQFRRRLRGEADRHSEPTSVRVVFASVLDLPAICLWLAVLSSRVLVGPRPGCSHSRR